MKKDTEYFEIMYLFQEERFSMCYMIGISCCRSYYNLLSCLFLNMDYILITVMIFYWFLVRIKDILYIIDASRGEKKTN